MNFRTVLMTSVVAASALAQPAFAQDAEAGSGPRLEEIIVTAQKREQSLKDVPISIASFGEEKLAKMGIAKIEDLATSVPNLFINNFNGTADTVRLFSMFAAPPEQSLEWNEAGVEGMSRFLRRLWVQVQKHAAAGSVPAVAPDLASLTAEQKALRRKTHETIDKVAGDYGRRHSFNTAIAAVMELSNALGKFEDASSNGHAVRQEALETAVLLLNPITPHSSHALWQLLGHAETLLEDQSFPQVDSSALVRDQLTLAIQVNGKLRGTIEVSADLPRDQIEAQALAEPNTAKFLQGLQIRKVIIVPGKIVNIVAA